MLLLATYDITVIDIICKEITWRAPCKNLFPVRRGCFLYWALQFDFDGKSEIGAICGTVQCRVLICHSVQKIIYGHDIILAGAKYASSSSWACKSNSPKPGSHLDIDQPVQRFGFGCCCSFVIIIIISVVISFFFVRFSALIDPSKSFLHLYCSCMTSTDDNSLSRKLKETTSL